MNVYVLGGIRIGCNMHILGVIAAWAMNSLHNLSDICILHTRQIYARTMCTITRPTRKKTKSERKQVLYLVYNQCYMMSDSFTTKREGILLIIQRSIIY